MMTDNPFHTRIWQFLLASILAGYIAFSLKVLPDFGMACDSPENFSIGHKYLHSYFTGHLAFDDPVPEMEGHQFFHDRLMITSSSAKVWPAANTVSAAICFVLHHKLQWLGTIEAHHVLLPFITAFFLFSLFHFVGGKWGAPAGFFSALLLLTYPRFFGETFLNVKDIPEIAFFSYTIFNFLYWLETHKKSYIFKASIGFILAAATKMDFVFIPVILISWGFCCQGTGFFKNLSRWKFSKEWVMAAGLSAGLWILAYPPFLFKTAHGRLGYFTNHLTYAKSIGYAPHESWNLYIPVQLAAVTPPIFLMFFIIGMFYSAFRFRKDKYLALMLVWFGAVTLRHSLPHMNHYDGIRHILIAAVPIAVLTFHGIRVTAEWIAGRLRLSKMKIEGFIAAGVIFYQVIILMITHPYHLTYLNSFVGGLKGGQEKNFPFSGDYWLHSFREGAQWLDQNAVPGASYYAFPFHSLFSYYLKREDLVSLSGLKADMVETGWREILSQPRSNTYVAMIPRRWWGGPLGLRYVAVADELKEYLKNWEIVYQIKRQDGEILTIYYRP